MFGNCFMFVLSGISNMVGSFRTSVMIYGWCFVVFGCPFVLIVFLVWLVFLLCLVCLSVFGMCGACHVCIFWDV